MRKTHGFTLIELMVAISVAAILLTVGIPSMMDFLRNNRRAAAVNSLVADVQSARSEAANGGVTTVLCHSIDGTGCSGSTAPDWKTGWIAFIDDNQDGTSDATDNNGSLDAGERLLSTVAARGGLTMPSTVGAFSFNPGYITTITGGTVGVCIDPAGGGNDRWIVVGPTGRPRLDTTNSDVTC